VRRLVAHEVCEARDHASATLHAWLAACSPWARWRANSVSRVDRPGDLGGALMATVSVRYIVDDVDAALRFYVDRLGFEEVMHPAPAFAMLRRGDLRLVLSQPGGGPGGGAAMPDGSVPTPGGWNRFAIEVDDVDALLGTLIAAGVHSRSAVIEGTGGRLVIVDDPSGNPVELFQPMRDEARLDTH
jgi:catechol 2,3-dioxygenase-like lactoylglutathione lyase family enzyme